MKPTIDEMVISKLRNEGLSLADPWSAIEACLARTVAPRRCIAAARGLAARRLEEPLLDYGNGQRMAQAAFEFEDGRN